MNVASDNPYTYEQAGFDGFYRRTLRSNSAIGTLRQLNNMNPQTRSMRFDDQQVSGFLGDTLKIGSIYLEGKTGRLKVLDEQGNEVVRLGDVQA